MGRVKPSLRGLDRIRPFTVLHLFDGVVIALSCLLFTHLCMSLSSINFTDTSSTTSICNPSCRTCKVRTFHPQTRDEACHIALLALCFQVRQAFNFQVSGANAIPAVVAVAKRQVTGRGIIIMPLAEDAVNPAVFVGGGVHKRIHWFAGITSSGKSPVYSKRNYQSTIRAFNSNKSDFDRLPSALPASQIFPSHSWPRHSALSHADTLHQERFVSSFRSYRQKDRRMRSGQLYGI